MGGDKYDIRVWSPDHKKYDKGVRLTKEEARSLMKEYYQMIEEGEYNSDKLGELNVYSDISKQPSRKKCATLPFQTLEKTLKISEIEIDD